MPVFCHIYLFCVSPGESDYLCPAQNKTDHYVLFRKKECFEFVNTEKTWTDAQSYCLQKNGNLVQIRNKTDQSFVWESLKSLEWERNGVWIGATDRHSENTWHWVTGEPLTYTNWYSGFHKLKMLVGNKDCGLLRREKDGQWLKWFCDRWLLSKYSFICQYHTYLNLTNENDVQEESKRPRQMANGNESFSNSSFSMTGNETSEFEFNSTEAERENSSLANATWKSEHPVIQTTTGCDEKPESTKAGEAQVIIHLSKAETAVREESEEDAAAETAAVREESEDAAAAEAAAVREESEEDAAAEAAAVREESEEDVAETEKDENESENEQKIIRD